MAQQQGKGTATGKGHKIRSGAGRIEKSEQGVKQRKGRTGKHPDMGEIERESR